jgi:lipopolysaccharide/colanic/teichoic acid biosynthesis glycosyltransferase
MSTHLIYLERPVVDDSPRRFFDVALALLGLICVSPIFLLIAVLIIFDSPGPIFYRAQRVGKAGRTFYLLKFRSMVTNADRHGPGITKAGDKRVTRIGLFLRRTKLDELPQLLNVLRGDMNLVGPRPEDPRYVDLYTNEQREILAVRPGITSAASLLFRYEEQLLVGSDWETTYRTQIMPQKLAIDLAYLRRRTLLTDLQLIIRTVTAMIR